MNNRTEQIINLADNKVQSDLERAKRLCAELQNVTIYDSAYREIIKLLIPDIPINTLISPPFIVITDIISIWENLFSLILIVSFLMQYLSILEKLVNRSKLPVIYSTTPYKLYRA